MAEPRWIVECEDLFGRDRGITVLSHAGWVVVVTPAGESAVLSTAQIDELVRALDAALSRAARAARAGARRQALNMAELMPDELRRAEPSE